MFFAPPQAGTAATRGRQVRCAWFRFAQRARPTNLKLRDQQGQPAGGREPVLCTIVACRLRSVASLGMSVRDGLKKTCLLLLRDMPLSRLSQTTENKRAGLDRKQPEVCVRAQFWTLVGTVPDGTSSRRPPAKQKPRRGLPCRPRLGVRKSPPTKGWGETWWVPSS